VLAALVLAVALPAADSHIEAPIPSFAAPMQEQGRYESHQTFDQTIEHYKWVFRSSGGVRWRNVVNLPQVRAKHIQSTRPKTKWQGINIYEWNGHVRIFVVPRLMDSERPVGTG